MALRPAAESSPHAHAVRGDSQRGPGQVIVSSTALTAHYGVDTTATRRWTPFVEDVVLCVDLTEEGTVITGNRTTTAVSSDTQELGASPAKGASSDSPVEGHSDST